MTPEDWTELVLEGRGRLSLGLLLERLVPLSELRNVATSRGLKPKGGFRVQRASAKQLGELLAEHGLRDDEVRDEVARLLFAATGSSAPRPEMRRDAKDIEKVEKVEKELSIAKLKLDRAGQQAKRERDSAQKARRSLQDALEQRQESDDRVAELLSQVKDLERQAGCQETELETLRRRCAELERRRPSHERTELVQRIEELGRVDEEQRREIARLTSRIRELEEFIRELESYLPRGQKERLKLLRGSDGPDPSSPTLIPSFTDDFFSSLGDMESEAIRRVYQAIAQLILSGLDYPGLQAKALKAAGSLWSIRAGVHHRVYFHRDGETVVFHHAGTREEQPTFLKKFKDT